MGLGLGCSFVLGGLLAVFLVFDLWVRFVVVLRVIIFIILLSVGLICYYFGL